MGKLKVWFLEVLKIALRIQFYLINFTNSLERGRKEVMGIILQQYLIGEVHFQGTKEFLSCRGFSGVHGGVQVERTESTPCAIVFVAGSRL